VPEIAVPGSWGEETEIDVGLLADVLRRHRRIVVVGVVLTLTLTVLSVVQVSPSGISFRSGQVWSNQATIVLTQQGAPELRSVLPAAPGATGTTLADTSRFTGLIDVYAAMATSDAVFQRLRHRGLVDDQAFQNGQSPVTAKAVVSTVGTAPTVVGGGTTPMMTISAIGESSSAATTLTRAATEAFVSVVNARQAAARIPVKDRIRIDVVKSSESPTLVKPRSKAMPMLVLLAGLIATAAVAFTRDNLARRRGAPVLTATQTDAVADASIGDVDEVVRQTPYVRATGSAKPTAPSEPTRGRPAARSRKSRHGRRTLGAVRGPDSAMRRDEDVPEDVEHQAPPARQSGASGRSSG
jgi:hypothetical protein